MGKLIYHTPERNNEVSKFDIALTDIVKNKKIKIACPFIGIYYINKLIKLCNDWRILTDINAWINSQNSKIQRNKIYDFLIKNKEKIHHYPSLHAKVIITDEALFLGSSNFTDNGIFRKNEMSILITDTTNIQEANKWFDAWWNVSTFPNENELKGLIDSNQQIVQEEKLVEIKSKAPKIKTEELILNTENKKEFALQHASEISIINYLRKWSNNSWEWDFFEHLKMAIQWSSLSKEDEYLTMTLTNSGNITLQINNRYILKSHSRYHNKIIGMMLPVEFRKYIKKYENEIHNIESFTNNKTEVALWVLFKKNEIIFDDKIYMLWKKAIKAEVKRKYLSQFRKLHQEIIYDLAMDIEKRKELFSIFND